MTGTQETAIATSLAACDHVEPRSLANTVDASRSFGLGSASFRGLLATQFLVVWNDNMFRWLAVPIAKRLCGPEREPMVMAAGLASFVLPFLFLAAPAGFLADRFRKRNVIVTCKLAEILLMVLGVVAILSGHVVALFGVVALLGAMTALLAPARLGSLPEIVPEQQLATANGWLGATTIVGAIGGTVAGNALYDLTGPVGLDGWWMSAAALLGVSITGFLASLLIRTQSSANPSAEWPRNPLRRTWDDLGALWHDRALRRAALGIAALWSLASLAQLTIDGYGTHQLGLRQSQVGLLLGALSLGVAFGSVLAGKWSRGQVEMGFLSLGSAVIAIAALLIGVAGGTVAFGSGWLLLLGVGAGLVDVPLEVFLQKRSPAARRGAVLAACNFLTFAGMLSMSGLYWLLRGPLEMSPTGVFLTVGIVTLPLSLYAAAILPRETMRFFVWLASKCVYRVKVHGLEHLPREGAALIVANHVSWIDGVLLLLVSPRPIRMMVYADYVENGLLARVARIFGAIPLKPGAKRTNLMQAINDARDALKAGELVCIFPEGALTRDGEMAEFKSGALHILRGTEAPVVPIYLAGLWGSIFSYSGGKCFWKWPQHWPFPVTLRFGKPIARPNEVAELQAAVASLREADREQQR